MSFRSTIEVRGAKENNLKNLSMEIPRDKLTVITGMSGSGKSSLAFNVIYGEGQRRFMESLSPYAKRFISQVKRANVDFVYGLSPVISIEQKTAGRNPRSTVGTMTDINDYIRLLYQTIGVAHCPYCHSEIPVRTPQQLAETLMGLPQGSVIELLSPIFPIYGEDFNYLWDEVRSKGYRKVRIDGAIHDLSEELDLDATVSHVMEVVVDKFTIRDDIHKLLVIAIESAFVIGEGLLRCGLIEGSPKAAKAMNGLGCPEHGVLMGEPPSDYFVFNIPDSGCRTCLGLGTHLTIEPRLMVPDPSRSIKQGAFVEEAYRYEKNNIQTMMLQSMAFHYGFSLETPWCELTEEAKELILRGTRGERFELIHIEGARSNRHEGKHWSWEGLINGIERWYRHERRKMVPNAWLEQRLKKIMVESTCPDCKGKKLRSQRYLFTINGLDIHAMGELSLEDIAEFIPTIQGTEEKKEVTMQVKAEIISRLSLLNDIGLNYLSLNRRSDTISGGEAQRIRLSTQIGSGLMGMLYVLDEPSIGLHPRDNVKMINTLKRLRDIGNTVIVVEHDEETILSADHVVEIGPGPGIHGGTLIAQGNVDDILQHGDSLTGQYLSGRKQIPLPSLRRKPLKNSIRILGAKENNLKNLDIELPLGVFTCITGVSGSGKSTLINQILYKKLYSIFYDSRVKAGSHDMLTGFEHITGVTNIDQSPIGRTPTSNPATYVGIYDRIRALFAATPESIARGYAPGRFSFNNKGGRCEECGGQGIVVTKLGFMPDVEAPCRVCHGQQYNRETLEITYNGKTVADVLSMSVEEGLEFFSDVNVIAHKLRVMHELGLGYLTLGQSSTTLSGGEAQRVKLATELGKLKRGMRTLYILDEPTTGLHMADVQRLLDSLNRLVDAGSTVVVIEHNMDVVKSADYVIDMGPEGGKGGGTLVAQGTPEQVAACMESHTALCLRKILEVEGKRWSSIR